MSKRTYTKHKLTHPQLKRLSQLYHGRTHLHGMALLALCRKGLVEEGTLASFYTITLEVRTAFQQARKEGW